MKFYMIDKDGIEPKDYHIIIPCNYTQNYVYMSWLVNLTDEELKFIPNITGFINFKNWEIIHGNEMPLYEFLLTKHKFNILGRNWKEDVGINIFDFDEYDLMYLKLAL